VKAKAMPDCVDLLVLSNILKIKENKLEAAVQRVKCEEDDRAKADNVAPLCRLWHRVGRVSLDSVAPLH